jgi:hemoglobin
LVDGGDHTTDVQDARPDALVRAGARWWTGAMTADGTASVPTLYQWAGGAPAFERLFAEFYVQVRADPELHELFAGMDPDHPRHVAAWLGEVFGGPQAYSEQRGGHAHMVGKHVGKAITERQRRRWVELLQDAADTVGLPADPEFRAAFTGYVEWGSRMAVLLSHPGAQYDPHQPMPRWTWPLPPWQPSAADGDT